MSQWLPLSDISFQKAFSSLRQQIKIEKSTDVLVVILKFLAKLTSQIQMEVGLLLEIISPFISNPKNWLLLFQAMEILQILVQVFNSIATNR